MEREPLDSVEYESTYLELRPAREHLTGTTHAPGLARRPAAVQVDGGAVASNGPAAAAAKVSIEALGQRTTPAARPDLALQAVNRSRAQAVHPTGIPPASSLQVTGGRCHGVARGHLTPLGRPLSRTLLGSSLLVVVSASLGILADRDLRAARGLFVAVAGVLILGWARLAWRGRPRAAPFGAAVTRVLDRVVTAFGTIFAIALWAKYAPHASAAFSRTVVLVLCGVGLVGGLLAASRSLHP